MPTRKARRVGHASSIVQSTGGRSGRADSNTLEGRYHVLVRGLEKGAVVDRLELCESVSRALGASSQWDDVLDLARSAVLRVILSNTTEKGYDLDPADGPTDAPPRSFPAKLLAVLRARWEAGLPGLTIVPCELREYQADVLFDLVTGLARTWKLPDAFQQWLGSSCFWLNTLVDRIVTGTPADHPLLTQDPMLTACEPYALFAIQEKRGADRFIEHPAVIWTPEVMPYFLRKVRILNGGHTALLIKAWPRGIRTVRAAVTDSELGPWLEQLLLDEVVPTLSGRVERQGTSHTRYWTVSVTHSSSTSSPTSPSTTPPRFRSAWCLRRRNTRRGSARRRRCSARCWRWRRRWCERKTSLVWTAVVR